LLLLFLLGLLLIILIIIFSLARGFSCGTTARFSVSRRMKVTNLLVYRFVQTSLVTASTWGDPTQVAAGYIALLGSKPPAPPERPQNFEELSQREKELTAMAGSKPEG